MRARLAELAGRLKDLAGLQELSLSSNGTRLGRFAARLRDAGVDRLNVSLDSLSRERFARITRRAGPMQHGILAEQAGTQFPLDRLAGVACAPGRGIPR